MNTYSSSSSSRDLDGRQPQQQQEEEEEKRVNQPCSPPPPSRRVFYFTNLKVSTIAYQQDHLMRPLRVHLLHSLLDSLGLLPRLSRVMEARPASSEEMQVFHRRAYLECLTQAPLLCGNPLTSESLSFQKEFDVPVGSSSGDCPLFPQVWELVASQAGGSLACAEAINDGACDVAIHWGGGMHHAAAGHASGFCFVNDIVLCIKTLLRRFLRVMYVDLDVHHGDGVEAAFLGNPRVMTLSLHQFGEGFFPGTGDFYDAAADDDDDGGRRRGGSTPPPGFAVNVPLPPRTGDAAYLCSFFSAFQAIRGVFDPEVFVVQCGADSICGDLIGRLCLTTHAHSACVRHILEAGRRPTILLGGGGYHVLNTVRCWAIHTATALGVPPTALPLYIPRTDRYYMDYREVQHVFHTPPPPPTTTAGGGWPRRWTLRGNRPTLHVQLDPDIDHPLPMQESLVFLSHLRRLLPRQMRAIRGVREGFSRTVALSLRMAMSSGREGGGASSTTNRIDNNDNNNNRNQRAVAAAIAPPSFSFSSSSSQASTRQHEVGAKKKVLGDREVVATGNASPSTPKGALNSRKRQRGGGGGEVEEGEE